MCPADYPYLYMDKFEQTNILALVIQKTLENKSIKSLCTYLMTHNSTLLDKYWSNFMIICCLDRF